MPVGKHSADPTTVLLDLHSKESSKPFGGLPPRLHTHQTFDPLRLSLTVSNLLES